MPRIKRIGLIGFCVALIASECIKDDFVDDAMDPVIRIINSPDTIVVDSAYQFEYVFLNNVGMEEMVDATWSSSETSIISINNTGLAQAVQLGKSVISVEYFDGIAVRSDSAEVNVGDTTVISNPIKMGTIATTSSYILTGDFVLTQNGADLVLEFSSNYAASSNLPGLFLYLTNNTSTTAGAYEVGAVTVFSGAHSYTIPNTNINSYSHLLYFCKPFNVKVGDGKIL